MTFLLKFDKLPPIERNDLNRREQFMIGSPAGNADTGISSLIAGCKICCRHKQFIRSASIRKEALLDLPSRLIEHDADTRTIRGFVRLTGAQFLEPYGFQTAGPLRV